MVSCLAGCYSGTSSTCRASRRWSRSSPRLSTGHQWGSGTASAGAEGTAGSEGTAGGGGSVAGASR
jgi:hypothetical protein